MQANAIWLFFLSQRLCRFSVGRRSYSASGKYHLQTRIFLWSVASRLWCGRSPALSLTSPSEKTLYPLLLSLRSHRNRSRTCHRSSDPAGISSELLGLFRFLFQLSWTDLFIILPGIWTGRRLLGQLSQPICFIIME